MTKLFRTGLLCALMAVVPAAFAQPIITLQPSSQSVAVGDGLSVDVVIDGLGDGVAPSVGVFDLDLSFDPALFSLGSVTFGTGLDVLGLGSLQDVIPGTGTVNLFELSFDLADDLNTLQASSFVLASVAFSALANGSGLFGLTVNALGDADGNELEASVLDATVRVVGTNDPPVTPVPEPASYALILAGLGAVGAMRRRRLSVYLA